MLKFSIKFILDFENIHLRFYDERDTYLWKKNVTLKGFFVGGTQQSDCIVTSTSFKIICTNPQDD